VPECARDFVHVHGINTAVSEVGFPVTHDGPHFRNQIAGLSPVQAKLAAAANGVVQCRQSTLLPDGKM
jgi:hypothetical protein